MTSRHGRMVLVVLLMLAWAGDAQARYARRDIQDVPLERLIRNLERVLSERPDEAALHHHLARSRAMAWALHLEEGSDVEVVERKEGVPEPWFGYGETRAVPFAVEEPPPAGAEPEPMLARAIESYERALKLDPADLRIRLGLAWCHEQAGSTTTAISGYRDVVELAWKKDSQSRGTLGSYLTSEAAGYLMPLLDPEADREELADLEAKTGALAKLPRMVTPIAIPLAAGLGPADLVRTGAPVRFDLDGSGRDLSWDWITASAAWLVWEPAGHARIGSGLQMFGSRSFLLFPDDGYEALALLDDDGDGWLRGPELSGLALWTDPDADGRSGPGEVRPLGEWGIVSLACSGRLHPSGIQYAPGGVVLSDGERRDSFDLVLRSSEGPDTP